ncbi:MAG: 4-(cytidine 5'-diphospho)-2-C-methyl-D-erythritol kinase [Vibrionaceae bacterium]
MQTKSTTCWPAPAKLNLFLYITGQRPDGYHNLQTLFLFLDHSDTLTITTTQQDSITVAPELPDVPLQQNLIYRAAKLLKSATGCRLGAHIEVNKILPLGAGLGGGSSNAATTLVALNRLWQLNVPQAQLAQLGLQLGADVPIFIHGHAAFAQGVGELLTPVDLAPKWYLVIKPPVSVSTVTVFRHPQLKRNSPERTLAALLEQNYENDCETIVRQLFPEVERALLWLLEYAPARLTGTGACIFSEFENEASARSVLEKLPDWLTGFVALGVDQSPLYRALTAHSVDRTYS